MEWAVGGFSKLASFQDDPPSKAELEDTEGSAFSSVALSSRQGLGSGKEFDDSEPIAPVSSEPAYPTNK